MPHLLATILANDAGIALTHVPFRGGSPAMQATAAGEVAIALSTEASARALYKAGKLRVLATTWPERSPVFPQAATFQAVGLTRLTQREWFGAFFPARTAESDVQRVVATIMASLDATDVREAWNATGLAPEASGSARLASMVRDEATFWGSVVKASGFVPEA